VGEQSVTQLPNADRHICLLELASLRCSRLPPPFARIVKEGDGMDLLLAALKDELLWRIFSELSALEELQRSAVLRPHNEAGLDPKTDEYAMLMSASSTMRLAASLSQSSRWNSVYFKEGCGDSTTSTPA
jgi:hypothetical protein